MNSQIVILLVVIVAIVVTAVIFLAARKRRSQNLREQFGPEYDRVVRKEGDVQKGERTLEFRQSTARPSKSGHSRQLTTRGSAIAGMRYKASLLIILPTRLRSLTGSLLR